MSLSSAQFTRCFTAAIKFLGWGDLGIKPYSIRRGGATHHFRQHANMPATIVRGRWASSRTARIYIEDGMAQIARLALSSEQSRQVRVLKKHFLSQVNQ